MGAITSLDALTDEQIERISIQRMKQVVGDHVELRGSTDPGHIETKSRCECRLCRNGVELDRAGKAVCLRCSRGSKVIDKAIKAVKAEERVLRTVQARKTVDLIKARAMLQMRGGRARRGPTVSPESMRIVRQTIKAELAKRGE